MAPNWVIPLGIIHGQKYVIARRMTRAGLLGSIETRHLHGLRRHLSGLPSSLYVHGLSQLLPLVSIESWLRKLETAIDPHLLRWRDEPRLAFWLRRRDSNPRSSGYEPNEMSSSLLHETLLVSPAESNRYFAPQRNMLSITPRVRINGPHLATGGDKNKARPTLITG